MVPLSVVIITHNEERNIGRCLQSVVEIADEVIVVDSYSTDKTPQICQSFDISFHQETWRGYSDQKNYANSLATYNWIISIDADEAISEELEQSILKWKTLPEPPFASFNRLTNYCGNWIKHSGWYPDTKIRIFDKTRAFWKGEIHETLVFDKSIQVKKLSGDLHHYSYYTLDDHYRQVEHFTNILAKTQFEQGKRAGIITLYLSPVVKFLRDYVLKLGILDGGAGFTISRISAYATFRKYKKIRLLQSGKSINT